MCKFGSHTISGYRVTGVGTPKSPPPPPDTRKQKKARSEWVNLEVEETNKKTNWLIKLPLISLRTDGLLSPEISDIEFRATYVMVITARLLQ